MTLDTLADQSIESIRNAPEESAPQKEMVITVLDFDLVKQPTSDYFAVGRGSVNPGHSPFSSAAQTPSRQTKAAQQVPWTPCLT